MELQNFKDAELWALMADVSVILNQKKQNPDDRVFMFWYQLLKSFENETDRRLAEDSLK